MEPPFPLTSSHSAQRSCHPSLVSGQGPPPPPPLTPPSFQCIWKRGFTNDPKASAEVCLSHIYNLTLAYTTAWQAVEEPSRAFDSERALVASALLVVYDAVARMNPGSSILASLLQEDGGHCLSTGVCQNCRPFEEVRGLYRWRKARAGGGGADSTATMGGRERHAAPPPAPHTSSGERASRKRKSPKLGGTQAAKQLGPRCVAPPPPPPLFLVLCCVVLCCVVSCCVVLFCGFSKHSCLGAFLGTLCNRVGVSH